MQCNIQDYETAILIYTYTYSLKPTEDEISYTDEQEKIVEFDPSCVLKFPEFNSETTEGVLEYPSLTSSRLTHRINKSIANDLLASGVILLENYFDFEILQDWFERSDDYRFEFALKFLETISLTELRNKGYIEESHSLTKTNRTSKLRNLVDIPDFSTSGIVINEYPFAVGDLLTDTIWNISVLQGAEPVSFQVQLLGIKRYIDIEQFKDQVTKALRMQTMPTRERIPAHFRIAYPELQGRLFDQTFPVYATINKLQPKLEYTIDVTLYDPAQLTYRTNIDQLDRCLLSVYCQLLERNIPVDADRDQHQKILYGLIMYRHNCSAVTGYIGADIAQQTETQGFHQHLQGKLGSTGFGIEVSSEPVLGNSRLDLLIEGYPAELKLENRKTITTDGIINSYKDQAADYISRRNAAFGYLVVLDTVLEREIATSPVDQDIRVVDVTTVSGKTVCVVAIVVRIPRSASELTKIHRPQPRSKK